MKIGSIAIACYEFDKMLVFWQETLHYIPREPAKGGWVILRDPDRKMPNVSLNQVPRKNPGRRSRLHLDVYTNNLEAEIEQLIKIGASRYSWRYKQDDDFRVGRSRWKSLLRCSDQGRGLSRQRNTFCIRTNRNRKYVTAR
jgi:hypothetical protein